MDADERIEELREIRMVLREAVAWTLCGRLGLAWSTAKEAGRLIHAAEDRRRKPKGLE
jgi:hypothetical protein